MNPNSETALPTNPSATKPPVTSTNQDKPSSMKLTLILLGLAESVISSTALYLLVTITELQQNLAVNSISPFLGIGFFVITLLLALTQLVVGIFSLDKKLGERKTWGIIIIGLIFAALTIPAIFMFVINPIYSNLSALE